MTPAEKGITTFPVYTFDGRAFSKGDVDIIQEMPLQIFLNGRHLATIACTGLHVDDEMSFFHEPVMRISRGASEEKLNPLSPAFS